MPDLKAVPLDKARGRRALHDMTEIVPGVSKGPAVFKGQTIEDADMCRLQKMGRRYLYLEESGDPGPDWVHENDAALAFAKRMAGDGICFSVKAKEGKIDLKAATDGLLLVDTDRLEAFNLLGEVMCAGRKNFSVVKRSGPVAGTRAIPLYLSRKVFLRALSILEPDPIFRILPVRKAKVGLLVTGTEVFEKRVKDRFLPIIRGKVEALGAKVVRHLIVPDDRERICAGLRELLDAGADLLITTAGLSVDPDDMTPAGHFGRRGKGHALRGPCFARSHDPVGENRPGSPFGGARLRPLFQSHQPGSFSAQAHGRSGHHSKGPGGHGKRRILPGMQGVHLSQVFFWKIITTKGRPGKKPRHGVAAFALARP